MATSDHTASDTAACRKPLCEAFRFTTIVVLVLSFAGFTCDAILAQGYLAQGGNPTFNTATPVELGFVNAANGNLHLEIPLSSFPQRGSRGLSARLVYDSRIWKVVTSLGNQSWQPTNIPNSQGGWRLVTLGDAGGSVDQIIQFFTCEGPGGIQGSEYDYGPFTWTAPDGTQHVFPISTVLITNCFGVSHPTGSALANDSSGYYMSVTNTTDAAIYGPDGSRVYPDVKDANGNFFGSDVNGNLIDTLGRTPLTTTTNCNSNPNQTCYDILNSQSTRSRYTVTTQTVNTCTNFGQSPVTECSPGQSITVIQSIALPDGTSYAFSYDSGTAPGNFGLLTGITLPTRGQVAYSYVTFQDAYGNKNRWVNTRVSGGGTWTFNPQVVTTCAVGQTGCQQKVTLSKPSGDDIVYTFTLNNGAWQSQVQSYSGAAGGTLLMTVATDYDMGTGSYIRPIRYTTTMGTSVTKKTELAYDNPQFGNIAAIKEWNYYSGTAPAAPDRQTIITYVTSPNYIGTKNIINLPLSVAVCSGSGSDADCNGAGTKITQTKYLYDSTPLTVLTGMANHDDSSPDFGNANTIRGNATGVQRWVSGTTYLSTAQNYDTTGQVVSTSNPAGNATTFGYGFQNAYRTVVAPPLIPATNYGYDGNTGLMTSVTDPNGPTSTVSFGYDAMNRPTQTTLPGGGGTLTQYTSAILRDVYTGITQAPSTACTGCRHDQITLNGLGRVITSALLTDPDGATSTVTAYDTTGRVQSASHPYRSAAEPTYGLEIPTYDGLDRAIKITHPDGNVAQTFYGAAVGANGGRSSQVCPATTCGLGYPVMAMDEAGKLRQSWVDGFGRTTEVDEPGLATAATSSSAIVTVTGAMRSTQTGGQPLTPGTGSVIVDGMEQSVTTCDDRVPPRCTTTWDRGTVSITVNGVTNQVSYGQNSTWGTIASDLAACINGAAPCSANPWASATASGSTVNLTSRQLGASTNYPLSSWSTFNSLVFTTPSFTTSISGCPGPACSLTGGTNAGTTTVYDTGTVSVTVNGLTKSATYGPGANPPSTSSTPSTIASDLVGVINADTTYPVSAAVTGTGVITLTSKATGVATNNYSVSMGSATTQTAYFTGTSFPTSPTSSTSFGGGSDADPSGMSNPAVTIYTYDLLNNLVYAEQRGTTTDSTQWRKSNFGYDPLSRATMVKTPEAGTTNLYYTNAAGALCSGDSKAVCRRQDARGVWTTYTYDALNRLGQISYDVGTTGVPATSTVTYSYDQTSYNGLAITNGIGRRTGMTDGSGATAWSYDAAGRVLTERRTISGVTKTISYGYNLDGSLASVTYPSGNAVTYTYSNAQRQLSAIDTLNGVNYATVTTYLPSGALGSVVNGQTGTFAGITQNYGFNNRLEFSSIQAISVTATAINLGYSFALPTGNNGSVASVTNNRDVGRTQSFSYDKLNRISAAQTQATSGPFCWGQSFGPDFMANLLTTGPTIPGCPTGALSVGVNPSNQIYNTGFSYDLAGNMTADGSYAYVWDAENRLKSATGVTYTYDGNNLRVQKSNGILYWRITAGDALAESDLTGTIISEYIFFAGQRIARRDSAGNVFYYFADHLGSTRVITTATGTVCYDADYNPYGSELVVTNTCPQNYKFTGYERDTETGLDYAVFRYYNSSLGRFMNPDPVAGSAAVPQSLNRYTYVMNDPGNLIDPPGMTWECAWVKIGNADPTPTQCRYRDDDPLFFILGRPRGKLGGGTDGPSIGGGGQGGGGGNSGGYLDLSGLPYQIGGEIGRRLTPKVCGGGGFLFAGGQLKIPGTNVHGDVLGVFNYDSKSGASAGGIGEVKVFGPFHAGGEVAYNFRSHKVSGEGLGFLGHETASAKLGAFGGGLLASSHGDVGGYGFVGPFGGGGYATLVLADTPCKP